MTLFYLALFSWLRGHPQFSGRLNQGLFSGPGVAFCLYGGEYRPAGLWSEWDDPFLVRIFGQRLNPQKAFLPGLSFFSRLSGGDMFWLTTPPSIPIR
ncbi:hypothetical protein HKBW3S25_01448, partial [Candidatus Hakubella thermalkaliphila]